MSLRTKKTYVDPLEFRAEQDALCPKSLRPSVQKLVFSQLASN